MGGLLIWGGITFSGEGQYPITCHGYVRVSEWIHIVYLPECQGTTCSKQAQYLKFKWQQQDWNPKPLSLLTNT